MNGHTASGKFEEMAIVQPSYFQHSCATGYAKLARLHDSFLKIIVGYLPFLRVNVPTQD
jgi:hypothetical protein